MQSELKILIAVSAVFAVALLGALATRRLSAAIRVVEGALVLPISFLGIYAFLLGLSFVGQPHFSPGSFLFSLAGMFGIVSLWMALFCRTHHYIARPRMAALLLIGLLSGQGVGLSYFLAARGSHLDNPSTFLVGAPMLVALHHLLVLGHALWIRKPGERSRGDV